MMVVITLSNCPAKVRGDLTKWLVEIDTGVFVGNLNSRVRDAVWKRICDNMKNGRASMAFGANNEQKLDFRIHNSDWEPVDYDGIKLVKRLLPEVRENKPEKLKIVQHHINRLSQRKKKSPYDLDRYVVIDIETTGLEDTDRIIEIGALRVENGLVVGEFCVLVKCETSLPKEIVDLTGITDEILGERGVEIGEAIKKFCEFCGEETLVGHNVEVFDMRFLQSACIMSGFPPMRNNTKDTMLIARRRLDCDRYDLKSVAENLEIEYNQNELHRALADCKLTHCVFEKLRSL